MILVDCIAAWLRVAYSTISRCTRAASLCRRSRRVCSSPIRLSISCTEVPATRCNSEVMLLATISLSFSDWRRSVATSRRTKSRISPSTPTSAGFSSAADSRDLIKDMSVTPRSAPFGRSSTVSIAARECDYFAAGRNFRHIMPV